MKELTDEKTKWYQGEIDRLVALSEKLRDTVIESGTRTEAAEREVAEIAAAIGCDDYLVPPDGGGVSLAEQVRRMRRSLQMAKGVLTKLEAAEQRCAELVKAMGNLLTNAPSIGAIDRIRRTDGGSRSMSLQTNDLHVREALAAASPACAVVYTAEQFSVITSGERGWCIKRGDDTICDVWESEERAKQIARLLNCAVAGKEST